MNSKLGGEECDEASIEKFFFFPSISRAKDKNKKERRSAGIEK